MRSIALCALACILGSALSVRADDLVMNGGTMELGGIRRYDNVCLTGGATLNVTQFNASDKLATGNLELIAGSIYIDATSKIVARGRGYQPALCSSGGAPNASGGGRGGCSVMDSGGGGAHFGKGGRGTVDNPTATGNVWQNGFPTAFEDDCMLSFNASNSSCTGDSQPNVAMCPSSSLNPYRSRTLCWKGTTDVANACVVATCATPPCVGASVAGVQYWHNIYEPEFGAAGGDKGCRDGDGRSGNPMGGAGGGRLVLVALDERNSDPSAHPSPCGGTQGLVRLEGTIEANGKRGCGVGNDSAGGGAGGSVLIVGRRVEVSASANVSAAGGLGGDTRAGATNQPDYTDCPSGAQTSGTCDDCGGGGGGGIISVLSVTSALDPGARFNVSGANGGTCGDQMGDATICRGEAGGGAGELQLDGAYVGEYCDGYDNDFDGSVDESLGTQSCGLGSCEQDIPACTSGVPVTCTPNTSSDASCLETPQNARPRIAVIVDTSASMLLDLAGYPTFGDGSLEHPGRSGATTSSRLYLAREALGQVISAYPEIDFSLARYHQDQAQNRSCQTAKWFECQGLVASYDDPSGNTGTLNPACNVVIGPDPDGNGAGTAPTVSVNPIPGADVPANPNAPARPECINYAGSCGPPRRGADVLSGFGTPVRDMVRWLDGEESQFNASAPIGDVCLHSQGNDCELRATGPTPLAGSLQAIEDYVSPIRTQDGAKSCRGYTAILVTDGAESCNGNPVSAATALYDKGIQTYVVAVSVLPEERASLNAIAAAGSPPASPRMATFVTQPEQLVPALTAIINDSIKFESCNGMDDDCDGKIDEDFPGIGNVCGDTMKGVCRSTGTIECNTTQDGTRCVIDSPGQTPGSEVCNSRDDDCDGAIDEALDCNDTHCIPKGEECNGVDDDCDMKVDETFPGMGSPCGEDKGECEPGTQRCVNGELRCVGGVQPGTEQCNGKDDDCDGNIDEMAMCPGDTACIEGACRNRCLPGSEFSCPVGLECKNYQELLGDYCVPTACALCKTTERCENDVCVDPCADVTCDPGLQCVRGDCRDCYSAGCPSGLLCYQGECQENRCASVQCAQSEYCVDGSCVALCNDGSCPQGQSCGSGGTCEADACAGVQCQTGEACRDGECVDNPCRTMGCTAGYVCVSDLGCVADACALTVCPEGSLCSLTSQGEPRCRAPAKPASTKRKVYVSTGGSGLTSCSVSRVGASASPPWAALSLGLLALVAWRRRPGRRRTQRRAGKDSSAPALRGGGRRVAGSGRRLGWALLLLGGCKTDAICLDCLDASTLGMIDADVQNSEGGVTLPDGKVVEAEAGAGSGGGQPNPGCVKLGDDEVCNELDDDCDGKVDEDFDFMTNVRHCGGCDQTCRADNADTTCEQGQCKVGACLGGFADLDSEPGCEYRCPFFPPVAEQCNGNDDDCDGQVDEALVAPSGDSMCRHTPGTPCANIKVVCAARENLTTWFCDYPSSVEFDPVVPDGIAKEETLCDGQDNDCDGVIDDPWPELGNLCDDGGIGACRNGGALACASDHKTTFCDLSLPPDALPGAGPNATELCNDLDDNCDGAVDNPDPGDPKHVVDDMRQVTHNATTFWIYTYEASRPDASGLDQGTASARSCSKPGAKPWTFVSYAAATAACSASGKRLCTGDEWLWACQSDALNTYPYSSSPNVYAPMTCNGADHDTQPGGALDNAVIATGTLAQCVSPAGAYDLSGNVKEWTSEKPDADPIYVIRGGSFESPELGLTCQTKLSQATASTVLPGLGFRCCSDAAP